MIELKFKAVGQVGRDGWRYGATGYKHYDASFTVTFDETKVNPQQVNQQVQEQMKLFHQYHPTGQVIQQTQRKF